jgi:TRAP-type C4-dicarboxylate transport system substrate-binding protein
VAMDPSELYLALQQGVVDGFEYPLPDLIAYKFYEVSKYLSLDGHTTDFFLIAINRPLWQSFAKEEQGMMAQALKTAMDWQWREQPGEIDRSLARLKTLMQVNELIPADKALFVEATNPVYAQFESSVGKEFLDFARQQLGSA